MKKKRILLLLLALFLLYVFWLGYQLLTFKTYTSPCSNTSSLEIEGVYHIHSTFSDGRKSTNQIAKIAAQAPIDFIILTDHGNPNFRSISSQGWKEGVLVLAGSELSVSRGHLVALGFNIPHRRFSRESEHAVYEIKETNGFSIIAHPYSRVPWSWGKFADYSGIEIINGYSMLKKGLFSSFVSLPALLIRPEYTLLKTIDPPYRNLRKWDELIISHTVYGYFGTDAHLLYGSLFNLLRIHVMLNESLSEDFETAKNQVYDALRQGRFYNSVSAAAQAKGFMFWGEKEKKVIPMGSTTLLDSPTVLHIENPFPFSTESHLIHNGKSVLHSSGNRASYKAALPGAYRVEVYLKEKSPLNKNIPWIVSNPIFLRKEEK